MIKSLTFFPLQSALNSREPLSAFLEGAQRHGIMVRENDLNADAAVIWSVLWNGRMAKNQEVYNYFRSQNRPVIVIDVGALRRNITWKVAVNHINALGYYGHQENLDLDRPRHLGIKLSQAPQSPKILLAAQHRNSLQMQNITSQESWILDQIAQLRNYTDREIIVRAHPRSPLNKTLLKTIQVQDPKKISNTYDEFDIDYGYHAVVNYNSGPGIQASLKNVNVIVDQTSLAYPISISIADIEKTIERNREQWLIEIAHTEYLVDEMRSGLPWSRLESKLNG